VFLSQEPAIGVIVQVYEAGRNDHGGGVDSPDSFGAGEVADGDDAIALDADICAAAGSAVTIYNRST